MKYYKKELTIKLFLTTLFPKFVDENLQTEIKEYYKSRDIDYNSIVAEQEKKHRAEFQKNKKLLLLYAPENLKSLIKNFSIYPIDKLPKNIIREFELWDNSIHSEVENCFERYKKYLDSVQEQLPKGFQNLNNVYLHDSRIISKQIQGNKLVIRIIDVQKNCYRLEFLNTIKFEYEQDIEDNIWKQNEIILLDNGFVEMSILTDLHWHNPMLEAVNEIRIIASDINIL